MNAIIEAKHVEMYPNGCPLLCETCQERQEQIAHEDRAEADAR
jgi:hypothetical protein